MGILYYKLEPELWKLCNYKGKGKHGGEIFWVETGVCDESEGGCYKTVEPMALLTYEEYMHLAKQTEIDQERNYHV